MEDIEFHNDGVELGVVEFKADFLRSVGTGHSETTEDGPS